MAFDLDLLTGLFAYYKCDGITGSVLADAHSAGPFDLAQQNSPGATASGKIAGARTYLIGSQQLHRKSPFNTNFITNHTPVGAQRSWAINFWVYPTVLSGDHPIMSTSSASGLFGHLIRVEATSGGRVASYASTNGTSFVNAHASGASTVAINTWNMITAGWDKAAGKIWLYLNGVFISEVNHAAYHTVAGDALQLGGWLAASSYFSGRLDEIAWWRDRVKLPQLTVDKLWNGGQGIAFIDFITTTAAANRIVVPQAPTQIVAPALPTRIVVD